MGVRDGSCRSPTPVAERARADVNKIIVNVGHFDVWNYGSNFFNVDILFSNANEPANNSAGGSTEFYGVYRGQFSPDKIFGLNTKFGPIDAINFEFGGDAETENTAVRAGQEAAHRRSELPHSRCRPGSWTSASMCRRNGTTTALPAIWPRCISRPRISDPVELPCHAGIRVRLALSACRSPGCRWTSGGS